jgi:fluoride exporter
VTPRLVGAVAAGGALGALARHLVSAAWPHPVAGFPWSTLVINLVGSLLIGVVIAVVGHRPMPRAFLATGVLGGFTTFSAYAVETRDLLAAGRFGIAALYALGTLAGALLAVMIGSRIR